MNSDSDTFAEPLKPLKALGAELRAERRRQRVSATTAADAAGISRLTLHRIEHGEPTVAMGSWLAAAQALGLRVACVNAAQSIADRELPASIDLASYPQLARLAWQQPGVEQLSAQQALALYERNWRHVDPSALSERERNLLAALQRHVAGGRLLV